MVPLTSKSDTNSARGAPIQHHTHTHRNKTQAFSLISKKKKKNNKKIQLNTFQLMKMMKED